MSDYMFMLESHLNSEQNKAVAEVRKLLRTPTSTCSSPAAPCAT